MTSIETLTENIKRFNTQRDWDKYHNPKDLLIALISEVGELADLYRWLSPQEVAVIHNDPVKKNEIEEELADILMYLLMIAYKTETDLVKAVERKMRKNERKYQVDKMKGVHSNKLTGYKGKE